MTYSENWQLLEEDIDDGWSGSGYTTDRRFQSIWSTRYIDDIVMRREDTDDDGTYDDEYYPLTDVQFSTVAIIDETAAIVERVSYDPHGKARHHYMGDVNGDGAITTSGAGSDYQIIIDIATGGNNQIGDSGTNAYRAEADLDRDGDVDASDRVYVLTAKPALPSGALSAIDNVIGWDGYIFNVETKLYCVRWRWYSPDLGRWVERDRMVYLDGAWLYAFVNCNPLSSQDSLGLYSDQSMPNTSDTCDNEEKCKEAGWKKLCEQLLTRINNIIQDIAEREQELIDNRLTLPEACKDDHIKPGLSKRGHRRLIDDAKKRLEQPKKYYDKNCKGPNKYPSRLPGFPKHKPIPHLDPYLPPPPPNKRPWWVLPNPGGAGAGLCIGGMVGTLGGSAVGGITGGITRGVGGTAVCPGVGTVGGGAAGAAGGATVGGAVGAVCGYYFGGWWCN